MKVGNSGKTVAGVGVSEARTAGRATNGRSAKAASPPAAEGEVHLSTLSSQLQALERSLANVEVVDSAKVEAIKQAISEGRFKVNPEVVADRLLQTVKDLVSKP
ncbi:MAG: flagellar biosynthesis anti-sigma factor FlgM [Burkholderiales bacterium]